ncbi:hypothetical protein GGQ73_003033 [Rhizobium skierniewicense]|uniref:Uncharacterized protein n=1 Tax=Rhizobium skierniewicense TaxID=984260 RepID=A0A7W6CCS3_9HYPH|nr:hypothetical protein [Rhizobium skierniewicense]MBB3947069.1 hypothetical protein [Rhizobium skierniewicense]
MVKKPTIFGRVLSLLKPKSEPVSDCASCRGTGVFKLYLGHGVVMKRTCWCLGENTPRRLEVTG